MDAKVLEKLTELSKALEAGYALGPVGSFTQGAALQTRDLSPVMHNLTFGEKELKLTKVVPVQKAKALVVEYRRQLSYGRLGSSATLEVSAGQQFTGDYVSAFSTMAFYTTQRVVSLAATMVQTFDGVNNEEREAKNAGLQIAGDVELDIFRGNSDFSNSGVFDGSPAALPINKVGMVGLDAQIRQSDALLSALSLDMYEYGAGTSSIINVAGTLVENNFEDAKARAKQNFGDPETAYLDYLTWATYNKLAYTKERIVLGGSPQTSQGAQLGQQWTVFGPVAIEGSRFLAAKERPPAQGNPSAPGAPTIGLAQAASSTNFALSNIVSYYVTGASALGEGSGSSVSSLTVTTAANQVNITITPGTGTTDWFNVYRTSAGTTTVTDTKQMKFIGRVANGGGATTAFNDLNNKLPGGVTAFLLDKRGLSRAQLAPFGSLDVAVVDTAKRRLYYQMECLVVAAPKFSIVLDNVTA